MASVVVFLSHISEESALADILRESLEDSFLDMIDVFAFKDPGSIELGSKWLDRITQNLRSCAVMLILCSETSVRRPWINFEAGAAWLRDSIPLIPICHTGMNKNNRPMPLSLVRGIDANQVRDLEYLYVEIARALGSKVPKADFPALAARIQEFEKNYGFLWKVRDHVTELSTLIPDLASLFAPHATQKKAAGEIQQAVFDILRPHLDWLQAQGFISYETTQPYQIVFGGQGAAFQFTINVRVEDTYYEIAPMIFEQA